MTKRRCSRGSPYAIIPACSGLRLDCARRLGDAALPVGVDRHSRAELLSLSPRGRIARSRPVLLAGGILLFDDLRAPRQAASVARLALVFAAIASLLSLVPVVQLPIALAHFNRAMAQTTAEPPARMPGDIRVTRGVPFSKADGVPLSLDVYQPAANGTFPIIMQIYGGSWQSGSPASQEWFSRHFAERGYVVVAIDYRHAPEWKWPEQIVDVRTALYWISEEARTIRRRFEPHRAGRAIGGRAARDAARVSGRSFVHTRRRELLRARRSGRTAGAIHRSPIPPTCAASSRCSSAARRIRSPNITATHRRSPGFRRHPRRH